MALHRKDSTTRPSHSETGVPSARLPYDTTRGGRRWRCAVETVTETRNGPRSPLISYVLSPSSFVRFYRFRDFRRCGAARCDVSRK